MKTKALVVLFLSVLLFLTCGQEETPFVLADTHTRCAIILELGDYDSAEAAHNAYSTINWFDETTQQDDICRSALAALELQHYLSRLLNIPRSHVPIYDNESIPAEGNLVFLGLPAAPEFGALTQKIKRRWRRNQTSSPQSFRLDSFNSEFHNGLVLSGKSSVGTLYAVYELLTRWGVRWFSADSLGEYVPRLSTLQINNLHEFVEPPLKIRGMWIDQRRPSNQADSAFVQWMGRNRLNLFWYHEDDVAALKQHGILINTGRTNVFENLLRPQYSYRYNHPKYTGDENFPTDPYVLSDFYKGDINNDGQLSYFEAHPEWFDVDIDSATHAPSDSGITHFCLSHSSALKEFSRLILDKLRFGEWKQCDIVDLWAPENWCACQKCQRMGNDTDKLLYVMYAAGNAIQEAREKGTLNRDAYVFGYSRDAHQLPTITLPKDFNDNHTALFLFTGPRCYNHFIISPKCININLWFSKALLEWLHEESLYHGDLYIMENYNAEYMHDLPTIHSQIMSLDIPGYAELGVQGLAFMHPRTRDLGVHSLSNYQFARQSWDQYVSVDTLRQEYFAFFYPGIQQVMSDYYSQLGRAMANISTWKYYLPLRADELEQDIEADTGSGVIPMNERFQQQRSTEAPNFNTSWETTYHDIFEARYLIDEAMSKGLPETIQQRLQELEYQLQYAELTINLYDNIITFFTQRDADQVIREEAILRLQDNMEKLSQFEIKSPALGVTNGLEASGVQNLVDKLVAEYPRLFTQR